MICLDYLRHISMHDLRGRLINSYQLNADATSTDVSSYENRAYVYFVKDEHNAILSSNKFFCG